MPMMGPLFALFLEPVSLACQEGASVPSDFSVAPDIAETHMSHYWNRFHGISCFCPILLNHPSQ